MPTIEEQQAQQNINNTFQQQRAARAAQFQSDQNKAQVGASSANTAFQNQDLATRQSILKGNNPAMPTAPTLTTGTAPTPGASVGSPSGVNAPGVIDRNNTVVGGGTVNPIGATGGATPTNGTPTTTSTTPTGTPSATPGILTAEELSPDMQTYLQNNPLAKSQFDLVARQGKEQQAKFLQDAEKAVIESKKQIGYDASQAANAKAQRDLNLQQNFQQGASAINKAEQNMYYSAVSPVTSGSQQTAAHGQIRDMAKQIDAMVIQNGLQNDAYAAQTAENARRIVLDLDNKIGETLNKKLQDIDNGVKNGDIATPEQLDRIFKENSEAILKEVPQLTNFAVQQMSDLTSNFMNTQKELRARQDVFNQNKNNPNMELSQVQGFFVDGNGNPILDAMGKQIEVPKEAPIKPTFDEKTGQLVTFGTDEYGNITAKATQVQGFRPEKQKPNIIETKDGLYNVDTDKWLNGSQNGEVPPATFAKSKYTVEQTQNGYKVDVSKTEDIPVGRRQCGEFVNDVLNGGPGWIPDLRQQKLDLLKGPGASSEPVAGSAFIMDFGPENPNGHVGIVEEVRENGIVISDMNRQGNEQLRAHEFIPFSSPEYKLIKGFVGKGNIQQGGVNLSGLSPLASIIAKGGEPIGTPSTKEKAFTELESKGFFDQGKGNANFYGSSIPDRDKLAKLAAMQDRINRVEELYNKGKGLFGQEFIGGVDVTEERLKNKLGIGNKDFAELENLVGKSLSDYIKDISGATVSPSEAERLERNIPSMSSNEAQFETALSSFKNDYNNLISSKLKQYGFNDVGTLKNYLGTK